MWEKELFTTVRVLKDNKLKEILFIIFALLFVVGLIVLRFRSIERLTPETELLIDLLRRINTNEKEGMSNGWDRAFSFRHCYKFSDN